MTLMPAPAPATPLRASATLIAPADDRAIFS
jgi:hypothetical protein